jgi:site-specific recombinase XerD
MTIPVRGHPRFWNCGSHQQSLLQNCKAIAGIARRFRFHDQRHTFASTLASKGINSFTLRDLLGHTSTRTTERYPRPSTEAFAAVAAALASSA